MGKKNDTGIATFKTDLALNENVRVRLDTGLLVLAGLTDNDWLGTLRAQTFAVTGHPVAVNLRTKPGTVLMEAAGVIAAGAIVFTAALGKIAASASTAFPVGIALEAAAADGDWIEVMVDAGETVVP